MRPTLYARYQISEEDLKEGICLTKNAIEAIQVLEDFLEEGNI